MFGLPAQAAVLRKARLRSTGSDRLHQRQQLECALADVEWSPPEIPANALFLVRRLVPDRSIEEKPLSQRVSRALRRQASRARRPWLHDDATTAEAILFADEAELIACLARDIGNADWPGRRLPCLRSLPS